MRLEKTTLTLGYMPLTDCAPLVVAQRMGFAEARGLTLQLACQPSWAGLRDRLLSGELDAAQALYGLPYGVELGLGGLRHEMAVLMTLNQNGQGIALARAFMDAVKSGDGLRRALLAATRRLTLAHTFPTGTHAMWLYYWLAAHRIHPLRDVKTVVVPPPDMAGALARGELDGFCAGEPWPAVAELAQTGYTLVPSAEIWPDHPEKVLATTRAFADAHPQTAVALAAALIEAGRWLDHPAQRQQAAPWIAEAIGVPDAAVAPRLIEGHGRGGRAHAVRFYGRGGEVCYPWLSDGMWFLTQYRRWGLLDQEPEYLAVASRVNRLDLYCEAARLAGADLPATPLRRSVLIDGRAWDGGDPEAYAGSFAIRA